MTLCEKAWCYFFQKSSKKNSIEQLGSNIFLKTMYNIKRKIKGLYIAV